MGIKGNSREVRIPELEKEMAKFKPRTRFWTDDEIVVLKKYYGRVPTKKLAEYLKRSGSGVRCKAQTLSMNYNQIVSKG